MKSLKWVAIVLLFLAMLIGSQLLAQAKRDWHPSDYYVRQIMELLNNQLKFLDHIEYEITEGPLKSQKEPRHWKYTITEEEKMKEIAIALSKIQRKDISGDYAGHSLHYYYFYHLTFYYKEKEYKGYGWWYPMVRSITFDLSGANHSFYDYSPLTEALKDYPPKFRAQQGVVKY